MIDDILANVLKAEGGYVNDPSDKGGETNWGITKAVARTAGYQGAMKDLPKAIALEIYRGQYVIKPGFGLIANISPAIAAELVDTGVNMGPAVPSGFLQRALNALNQQGADYPDIVADGRIGAATVGALKAFLAKRGAEGERRLLALLNALQGARYLSLAEGSPSQERFMYGWLDRVVS
jgi:lysozyme family protein